MLNILRFFSNAEKIPLQHNIKIGIFAGMGAVAGADFYHRLETSLHGKPDYEHPIIYLYSNPTLPRKDVSVLEHLQGKMPVDLMNGLIRGINFFDQQKVDFIVIPCNTVHYFLPFMQKATHIPIINMVDAVKLDVLRKIKSNEKAIGILATEGTIKAGLYQKVFTQNDIHIINPSNEIQAKTMRLIESVKNGHAHSKETQAIYHSILKQYYSLGIQTMILGCTELPVIPTPLKDTPDLIDTTQSLIDATLMEFTALRQQRCANSGPLINIGLTRNSK